MTSVSVHHLQIEREIEKYPTYKTATFSNEGTKICTAWVEGGARLVSLNICTIFGVEKASVMCVAIQMAIDWLTEQ